MAGGEWTDKLHNQKGEMVMTTQQREKMDWFKKLPEEDQDIIYGYFESFKTHDLWDWIIELLPKKDLVQILESNREDQE